MMDLIGSKAREKALDRRGANWNSRQIMAFESAFHDTWHNTTGTHEELIARQKEMGRHIIMHGIDDERMAELAGVFEALHAVTAQMLHNETH